MHTPLLINQSSITLSIPQLPYDKVTTDAAAEIAALQTNSDVSALRNLYRADLVMLIGYFPDTCGIG